MKKLIIFCILICSLTLRSLADGSADARYPVYLDLGTSQTSDTSQTSATPKKAKKSGYNKKIDVKKGKVSTISQYEKMNKINTPNFSPDKTISAVSEKIINDKTDLGVKYTSDLKNTLTSQSRTFYVNRKLTDKFSLGSSYKTNPMAEMSEQLKGTVALSPEFKLTEHASLKSVYAKNISGNSYSGEFQFKYKPFKDNRFDMNIGAGQTVYDDSRETSTKVNFGTNINF